MATHSTDMPTEFEVPEFVVSVKRAYDKPSLNDGVRILVESAWPRGLGKEAARIDLWLTALAPSQTLAKWFTRGGMRSALARRYFEGLKTPQATAALEEIYNTLLRDRPVTLLYAGNDAHMNAATLLKELIEGHQKPPNSTGPAKAAAASGRARAVARRPRR